MGDPAGQLADRLHLLRLAQLLLELGALSHVAADEEVLLIRLRPDAAPRERNRMPVLVDVAAIEIAHHPAAARSAHLMTRVVEVLVIDELRTALPDHLLGASIRGWAATRACLQDIASPVADHDQVERCVEDALPQVALLPAQLLLGAEQLGEPGVEPRGSNEQH